MPQSLTFRRALSVSPLRGLAAIVLLLACAAALKTGAQTTGAKPPNVAAGSPAGSYSLSGFENVNLYSGNLNFNLPLLQVGGRGGAQLPVLLSINSVKWGLKRGTSPVNPGFDVKNNTNGAVVFQEMAVVAETHYYHDSEHMPPFNVTPVVFLTATSYQTTRVTDGSLVPDMSEPDPTYYWLDPNGWVPMSPGFRPGIVEARTVTLGSKQVLNQPGKTLTRIIFIAPDSSEIELRDVLHGGQPYQFPMQSGTPAPYSRGTVFVSDDGVTFISDAPVTDTPSYFTPVAASYPSGYLLFPDGTRYRVRQGAVSWIRDRNGNLTTYHYTPEVSVWSELTKITDSLGREVSFSSHTVPAGSPCPYNDVRGNDVPQCSYEEITYKGFGGAPRSIKVWYAKLSQALRGDMTLGTYATLFPQYEQSPEMKDGEYDADGVVTGVELPDGRSYRLRYNPHNELARVELPTGGAFEYDYATVAAFNNLQRRVTERRVYESASDAEPELIQKYIKRPAGTTEPDPPHVTTEQRDGHTGALLSKTGHWFYGSPMAKYMGFYSSWLDGRESGTVTYALDGVTRLREVKQEWEARAYPSWYNSGAAQNQGPAVGPRLRQTEATQLDVSPALSSKQVFHYDTDSTLAYNLLIGVEEYGFGAELLRSTETEYVKESAYTNAPVHMRGLPKRKSVRDAGGTERARTTFEYDNYTPDGGGNNRHAALVFYEDIFGLCTTFGATGDCSNPDPAAYTTRGNVTGTTSYLLDKDGNVTGSVTGNSQYDIAGNVVKTVGARSKPGDWGYETNFDYTDNFGAPDASAQNKVAPANLSSVGKQSYALPGKVTNMLGHTAYTQYDYHTGQAVNFEDANGTVMSLSYGQGDPLDRLSRVVSAANYPDRADLRSQTTYSYDDASRKITTTSDLKVFGDNLLKGEGFYDGLGRTTEARQYENSTQYVATLTKYDALGRASEVSNPFRPLAQPAEAPVWTATGYDALGRMTMVTTPDGAQVYTLYDGLRTLVVDQAGQQRISQTDALGRLTDVWEITAPDAATEQVSYPVPANFPHTAPAAGYRTSYGYDVLGNLRKVEQGAQRRYFAYDSLGHLLRVSNPEQNANVALELPAGMLSSPVDGNNAWTLGYEYDEAGNLKKRTDARGVETNYTYDALGRLMAKDYTDVTLPRGGIVSTPSVKYYYDSQALPTGAPAFDRGKSTGQLVAVTYGGAALTTGNYTGGYDELGRARYSAQVTISTDAAGLPAVQTYAFGYEYNLDGSLKSETYPSGRVIASEYDAAGRLAGVKRQGGGYYAGGDPAVPDNQDVIAYAAHGAVTAMRLGNGLWEHTLYNSRFQPYEIGLGVSPTDSSKLMLGYGYTSAAPVPTANNGNVLSQTISVPAFGETPARTFTQTYTYDPLNRLATAEEMSGAMQTWTQGYSYDRFGNRSLVESQTKRLNQSEQLAATVDDSNRAALNPQISSGTNRITHADYSYDAAGNLLCDAQHTCAPQTSPTSYYGYDGESRMVRAGGGAEYVYDGGGQRVKKILGTSTTVFVYDAAGKLVAEYGGESSQTGGTSYLTSDTLDSTRLVTGQNQGVKARFDYLPFGGEVSELRAGYDVSAVRQKFTGYERDSETNLDYAQARYYANTQGRFTSVDPLMASAKSGQPQSWNRYTYVLNNPLLLTDPSGLDWAINHFGSGEDRKVGFMYYTGSLTEEQQQQGWEQYKEKWYFASEAAINLGTGGPDDYTIIPKAVFDDPAIGAPGYDSVRSATPGNFTDQEKNVLFAALTHVKPDASGMGALSKTMVMTFVESMTAGAARRGNLGEAGSIRNVNPSGSLNNCVSCVIATDATLAGRPASALPGRTPNGTSFLENLFGRRFVPMSQGDISQRLLDAGPGARGIVFGSRGLYTPGHVFNGVNQGGVVRFLDGQTGGAANWNGYRRFYFMYTHNPNSFRF